MSDSLLMFIGIPVVVCFLAGIIVYLMLRRRPGRELRTDEGIRLFLRNRPEDKMLLIRCFWAKTNKPNESNVLSELTYDHHLGALSRGLIKDARYYIVSRKS